MVDLAARVHRQHPNNILGKRRYAEYVKPRQHVMALLRSQGFSYGAIAEALGGLDHTTVLHGVRAHAARCAEGAK